MVQALLDGFSSTGSDTNQIYLADKDIGYCSGCYSCWTKTPGVCIHKDDMRAIINEMKGANY
jgi:multimeric flavodoxin WrbA